MISFYFYCWWVEDVSFQSPLVGPCIHTHIELYKGLTFKPEAAPGRNHKPKPAWSPTFIIEARFRPESQIYVGTSDVRNCGVTKKKRSCRYTVYHTENSNHLHQTIGIIWHKCNMLVNDITAEYNVSQEKKQLSTMAL